MRFRVSYRSLLLAASAPIIARTWMATSTSAAAAAAAAAAAFSTKVMLPENVQASLPGLYTAALHPLDLSTGGVHKQEQTKTLREIVQATGAQSTVAFVVRRPGCVLCREHGHQLSELAAIKNTALLGVVKETGVDDQGLLEFYNQYFTFPLYQDRDLTFYQSFGNRKIALTTWNPIRIVKGYFELNQRIKQKNLSGNMVGEGIIQGGVMVFNRAGELYYAQQEEIGNELDMDAIRAAVSNLLIATIDDSQETVTDKEL